MNYVESIAYISSLEKRGWRLGLDRMREFLRLAGLENAIGPERRFIHIAGTNGKGSVTAYVQRILIAQGLRTGGFFSPYVFDVRERIQVQGELVSEATFAESATELAGVADQMVNSSFGGPTEFEFKTAMGFWIWDHGNSEYVALEVGLGGRLDATNVVTPASTAIVSIGLDHTEILGDTLAEIAAEKAGIIKPDIPVVVGQLPKEANQRITQIAKDFKAPTLQFGTDIILDQHGENFSVRIEDRIFSDLKTGIVGVWQPHNAALAIACCLAGGVALDEGKVRLAIADTKIPGRMQTIESRDRKFLLDGAHNPDSASALSKWLDMHESSPRVAIAGMVHGHHAKDFFEVLVDRFDILILTRIDFHRTQSPDEIARQIAGLFPRIILTDSAGEAIDIAVESTSAGAQIVVTGSFYLVGEIGRDLAKSETRNR